MKYFKLFTFNLLSNFSTFTLDIVLNYSFYLTLNSKNVLIE